MRARMYVAMAVIAGAVMLSAHAADLALYNGTPNDGWYDPPQVPIDVDAIVAGVSGIASTDVFTDDTIADLAAWAEARMNDGKLDIIWLPGVMPSTLYPNPNVETDGSVAERWLEGGNMFINVADWMAYTTYETGSRGDDNGGAGAENILNLPGIIAFGDNTDITVTADGQKYLPSIGTAIVTDRPVPKDAIVAPWEAAAIFGEDASGANFDPVVIHNTDTGAYVALMNQANKDHSVDRAQMTIELINNWVSAMGLTTAVEPAGKLTTTWASLKR